MRGSIKAAALLIAAAFQSSRSVADAQQSSCPDTLDRSHEIDSYATLYYAVVPSDPEGSGNGLLCGRLEAENDGGWIGIGFSSYGLMRGSQAVIGIPAEGTVLKYDLSSRATLADDDRQTLTGTSLAEADGVVTMEFAKLLVEEGEVAIVEGAMNRFIHARGSQELGYHTNGYKQFSLDFGASANATAPADVPKSPPPSPAPDASAVSCSHSRITSALAYLPAISCLYYLLKK